MMAHPGKTQPPSSKQRRRRSFWDLLFLAFTVLAALACGSSVLTGSFVLPKTQEIHKMDHSETHASFDAPAHMLKQKQKLLRQHNEEHLRQFKSAYNPAKNEEKKKKEMETENGTAEVIKEVQDNNNNSHNDNNNEIENDNDNNKTPQKYHMVFSTSCSPFQNWQSLAFFYFARKVQQPGTITRLVSGCTEEQTKNLEKVHRERVVPLAIEGWQTFEMHVTPNFDDSKGGDQKYFNKPNGLLHWMENSLGFKADNHHSEDDSIIIIVDPDMMLLRPITKDFSPKNYNGGWVDSDNTRKHKAGEMPPLVDYSSDVVTHGKPHAQRYGYGAGWITALDGHEAEVVGPDSPVLSMSVQDAADYYPAGPPYVATARDMYKIAVHWVKFLPKYHTFFQGMMCEMHSYSLAAAHLRLPHKLAEGFMVSDYESDENFSFIDDKMSNEDACMEPPRLTGVAAAAAEEAPSLIDVTDMRTVSDPSYESKGIPIRNLPYVLHYCQRYALGRYFFSKYKLPEHMFDTCDGPLLIEPPRNVTEIYDWNIFPNGVEHWDFVQDPESGKHVEKVKPLIRKRNGWLLCAVLFGMNEAITHYKTASCGKDPKFFQKKYHFHTPDSFQKSVEDPSNPFQKKKKEEEEAKKHQEHLKSLTDALDHSPIKLPHH